jgi:hypothetical protein
MQLIKGMMVAASAAFVVAMAEGCTSTVTVTDPPDSGTTTKDGGNGVVDSGVKKDSSVPPPVDGGNTGACAPGDVSSYMPTYVPAAKTPGACTQQAITDFDTKCLGPNASNADCSAWAKANANCGKCLESPDSAAKYGPLILHTGYYSLNIGGCFELAGDKTCGAAIAAPQGCTDAACAANCPVSDQPSFDAFTACGTAAEKGNCKKYVDAAQACEQADGGVGVAKCTGWQDFDSGFLQIAGAFCL